MFKMLKNNICNTEFEVCQAFVSYEGIYPKHSGIYLAPICWKVNQFQT